MSGRVFASGIGILSDSRMQIRNDGRFAHFVTDVGIDDATRNRQAVVRFSVYGDGRLLAETGMRAFGDAPTALNVDIAGVRVVELVARSRPSDGPPASIAWGNAALLGVRGVR